MQNLNQDFIDSLFSFQAQYPLIYSVFLAVLYGIAIFLIVFMVRKIFHLFRSKSPNLVDGLVIILDFSALAIWVAIIAPLFHVPQTYILGGSALGVAIIGISASYLGANFMGGLFIIFFRPFGVGDIINYNGNLGLVTEIGLNYTKLLKLNKNVITVCNSNIVNALIHNSSVFVKQGSKKGQLEINLTDTDTKNDKATNDSLSLANKVIIKFNPNKLTQSLTNSLNVKKIVRLSYTFDIRQDMPNLDCSIASFEKRLKKSCLEFTEIFGFEPEFFFVDNYWRITTTLVITAINAIVLFNNYSNFLERIIKNAYQINIGV